MDGISSLIEDIGIDAIVQGSPAAFTIFFTKQEKIENYREFLQVDKSKLQMFVKDLLKERIFIVPSTSHKFFISTAHTHDDIKNALEVAEKSLKIIKHIG